MVMDIKQQYKTDYTGLLEMIENTIGDVDSLGLATGKNGAYLFSSIKKCFKVEYGFYINKNTLYDLTVDSDVDALADAIGEYETEKIVAKYNSY